LLSWRGRGWRGSTIDQRVEDAGDSAICQRPQLPLAGYYRQYTSPSFLFPKALQFDKVTSWAGIFALLAPNTAQVERVVDQRVPQK
jgi:hypothetical protein